MPEIPFPFQAPKRALADRKHGPCGLSDYRSYKPWLRDEHDFRCVYCLSREMWDLSSPSGSDKFTIDHIVSRHHAPGEAANYDNLCYCCSTCNSRKRSASLPSQLIHAPLCDHFEVDSQGRLIAKTADAKYLVELLRLNNPARIEWRKDILEHHEVASKALFEEKSSPSIAFFVYPSDLDDLATLRPRSNTRPNGISQSAFARRSRGELAQFY